MNRTWVHLVLAAAVVAGVTSRAGAGEVGQCIKAATVDYKECKAGCKEDYQSAKDACINKDHTCVEACREKRLECRDPFDSAIRACNDQQQSEITNCRSLYGAGTPERDTCIDNAQLAGFQCRDQAREDFKALLTACRKGSAELGIEGFRPCVNDCPDGAGPVEDPKQCKLDASVAYKACGAACREDFQIAKDACRNRDHACVEGCRVVRQTCKDPIQATLDAAIAQCQLTKQGAVAQ